MVQNMSAQASIHSRRDREMGTGNGASASSRSSSASSANATDIDQSRASPITAAVCPLLLDLLSKNWPAVITAIDIRDRVRMDVLDYLQPVSCLRGYLRDKSSLELWSREFFLQITQKIQTV